MVDPLFTMVSVNNPQISQGGRNNEPFGDVNLAVFEKSKKAGDTHIFIKSPKGWLLGRSREDQNLDKDTFRSETAPTIYARFQGKLRKPSRTDSSPSKKWVLVFLLIPTKAKKGETLKE